MGSWMVSDIVSVRFLKNNKFYFIKKLKPAKTWRSCAYVLPFINLLFYKCPNVRTRRVFSLFYLEMVFQFLSRFKRTEVIKLVSIPLKTSENLGLLGGGNKSKLICLHSLKRHEKFKDDPLNHGKNKLTYSSKNSIQFL